MNLLAIFLVVVAWLALYFPDFVTTQHFHRISVPVNYPGITERCYTALNSTLDCAPWLWEFTHEPTYLTLDQVQSICTPSCYESLINAQEAASSACITKADVIWDGQKLRGTPATWTFDKLLYTFNSTCVKDRFSGELCASALKGTPGMQDHPLDCSQCALDTMDMKLKSPLEYSNENALEFSKIIDTCNATGYHVTSPAPTTTNVTHPDRSRIDAWLAAPTPAFTDNCTRWGKVRLNDTYNSLAAANNVSSFWLRANDYNADVDFDEIPRVGTSYCLPPGECQAYKVQENETCDDIIMKASIPINSTQLELWNPDISEVCSTPGHLNGTVVCLSSPPECTWCHRTTTTTTAKASTFSGFRENWDSYWPEQPYTHAGAPLHRAHATPQSTRIQRCHTQSGPVVTPAGALP
ncbi:hypothetical protein M409DRAFT_24539 [Zasmidium cellare ATCC 36951]|uniref:Carbohydrate-binding module family 50 protein n=1 Tax=Zasmidium cellare ATCC 36951 TaxID=1080233 RepID=A0A6A6CFY6_ZASCE|nr:uncharacterized protein M409DRAFT_24539 [Zasmidium cellare ATCC 36951]KAF2165150.1 hypothetical protein M409DRAFT_24539 [Zasmidium cellare ATCC 36951]